MHAEVQRYYGETLSSMDAMSFDKANVFETGRSQLVDGNTAQMLENSRLARHFEVVGEFNVHLGSFQADTRAFGLPFDADGLARTESCCWGAFRFSTS
ncbi:MAG: hypothetical protein KJO13_08825 [Gammaproteobacteria bacterium]|nr:hypothetical protein [Gammaproteobacteria bacterium]